ncbi:MAG TPA: 2Fe-2S iron-sulfur cluster-binding protein, partial [Bacteroidota bacterium]|nr:2Fe-2S iron-sulfur cluster-binding protein [Bacteroidota bacterium]
MGQTTIEFMLNGAPFIAEECAGLSLMDVLREQAGLISPKNGCAPQGSCGCCTVILEGKAVSSCAVPIEKAAHKHVITLEGLSERERAIYARAFTRTGGLQCGFCTPGIVMRSKHLLDKNPLPTRDEIAAALNNHICRCTGYVKIIDAIELAAKALQGGEIPEADYSGRIGSRLPKMDSEKFAMGERPYIDDITMDGMQYAAFVFSPHPRIRVDAIDASAAEQLAGVTRVVTARDVPGERVQGLIYRDWPLFIAEGEITHCIGDILAAVIATDVRTARCGAELVKIAYEKLPGIYDPEEALKPGAIQVHDHHANLLDRSIIKRGDVDAALQASAFVETRTFETQMIEHAFLEPESAIASVTDGIV